MQQQNTSNPIFTNIGNKKLKKDDLIFNAIGDLDELNSFINICYCYIKNQDLAKILDNVQTKIFIISSELVSIINPVFKPDAEFTVKDVEELESLIQKLDQQLKRPKKFILFHEIENAYLGYARAIARRSERSLILASSKYNIKKEILNYINKLSLLLFLLALYVSKINLPTL